MYLTQKQHRNCLSKKDISPFTVLGLTVQVFLEMFNRMKVCEKKEEETAGTADVIFFFF